MTELVLFHNIKAGLAQFQFLKRYEKGSNSKLYKHNERMQVDSMISKGKVSAKRLCFVMALFFCLLCVLSRDVPVLFGELAKTEGCGTLVSGPSGGRLDHKDDGQMEKHDLKADVKDFIAEVTFYNPYSSNEGSWDYGFLFRYSSPNTFHAIRVTSDSKWYHYVVTNGEWSKTGEGKIGNLQIMSDQNNHLYLIVSGNSGLFYVNGKFMASLDTSSQTQGDYISIAIGMVDNTETEGETTRFEDFSIWSLDVPAWVRRYVFLWHRETDSFPQYNAKVEARDFIVAVTFHNPYSSYMESWDYGILFRSQNNAFHAIRVTSDGKWYQYVVINGEWSKVGEGRFGGLQTKTEESIHLRIFVLRNEGFLFVNDKFVTSLITSDLIQEGSICAAVGMGSDTEVDDMGTMLLDFTIWSLDCYLPPHGDKDSDGVFDPQDNCQNPGCAIVDSNGCPEDSDNDGIIDCDDDCSSEYGEENYNGCPSSLFFESFFLIIFAVVIVVFIVVMIAHKKEKPSNFVGTGKLVKRIINNPWLVTIAGGIIVTGLFYFLFERPDILVEIKKIVRDYIKIPRIIMITTCVIIIGIACFIRHRRESFLSGRKKTKRETTEKEISEKEITEEGASEEMRKVVREELKESERRVLSGVEQMFEKSHREQLERIETLNNIQIQEFKNAVSKIIEEKIENIKDPNEKEKNRKEYNNWKKAFKAAGTSLQIVGSIASIYTLFVAGRPEEAMNEISTVINTVLSRIEKI